MKKRTTKRTGSFTLLPKKHFTGTLWLWWLFRKPANKWGK